jgi:hypothetical protein
MARALTTQMRMKVTKRNPRRGPREELKRSLKVVLLAAIKSKSASSNDLC